MQREGDVHGVVGAYRETQSERSFFNLVLPVLQEELVELVLSQQSTPTSGSAPDTPIAEPPMVTSDPPDPTPRISASDTASDTSSPAPPTSEPEAPPTEPETPPSDPEMEDDDPVRRVEELDVVGYLRFWFR